MKCESSFFGWTEKLFLRVDKNKQEPQATGKRWGYYHVIDRGMGFNIRQTWV